MNKLNKILGGLAVFVLLLVFGLQFFLNWDAKRFLTSSPELPAALVQENVNPKVQTHPPMSKRTDIEHDTDSTPAENSEKTAEQLHKEAYALELQARRENYKRRQQLAMRLGMQTDPPPTTDELETAIKKLEAISEIREAQTAEVKIEELPNSNNKRTEEFVHWFKGYAVEQQARLDEVEFLLQTPNLSGKKFVELVPNLDDRLYYIEIFREITDMNELSTRLASTPKSFRDALLAEIEIRWTEGIGGATVNRLISETNRKAQN